MAASTCDRYVDHYISPAGSILFPCYLRYTNFWKLSCSGMGMVIYSQSIVCRPRYAFISPAQSYLRLCIVPGIIMGFPTTLSMNLVSKRLLFDHERSSDFPLYQGMLVGWGILSPIAKLSGWAPGSIGSMTDGARGWILWVSLAIMLADSLISLTPVAWEYVMDVSLRIKRSPSARRETKDDRETETPDRLVPTRWVVVGWCLSVAVGMVFVWLVFGHEGIKPYATFAGYIIGGILSVLA